MELQASKVSVIMPVYNAEKYLVEAIESVLNQTYKNIELILIEDYSTDSSRDIVKQYATKSNVRVLLNEENKGIAYSTNRGIIESNGDYIALMDDDDISLPERIEKQVRYLDSHPSVDAIGAGSIRIDENGDVNGWLDVPKYNPKYNRARLLFYSIGFCNGTLMIRNNFIKNNRLKYEDNCLGMQDYKFYIDAVNLGKFSAIPDILYKYRWHGENESIKQVSKERTALYKTFIVESINKQINGMKEADLDLIASIVSEKNKYITDEQFESLEISLKRLVELARLQGIDYLDEVIAVCKQLLATEYKKRNIFG